jgi:hypothetical protein
MTKYEELSEELKQEVDILCASMGMDKSQFDINQFLENKNQ